MRNDINFAKQFRDDYFLRIGHGMNDHTVISLMIAYAAEIGAPQESSSVDLETLLQDKENLSTLAQDHVRQIADLEIELKQKEDQILELQKEVVSLNTQLLDIQDENEEFDLPAPEPVKKTKNK